MVHKYLRVDNFLFWLPRPLFPLPFPLKLNYWNLYFFFKHSWVHVATPRRDSNIKKSKERGLISIPGLHLLKTCDVLLQRATADVGPRVWMHRNYPAESRAKDSWCQGCQVSVTWAGALELASKVADALSPKTWWCHAVRTWGLASWAQPLNYCVTLGR